MLVESKMLFTDPITSNFSIELPYDARSINNEVDDVEEGVQELQDEMNDLSQNIQLHVKGQLSEEHQAQLDELLSAFQDSTAKVDATVKAKKKRVRVKIKIVEERESGHGKHVTVEHTDLMKTNQGKKGAKAVQSDDESDAGDEGNEAVDNEGEEPSAKGKPDKDNKGKKK